MGFAAFVSFAHDGSGWLSYSGQFRTITSSILKTHQTFDPASFHPMEVFTPQPVSNCRRSWLSDILSASQVGYRCEFDVEKTR